MGVVGFSFKKFDCVRNAQTQSGSIEINHQIGITDVEKTTLNVGTNKNDVLRIIFSFDVKYSNDVGHINIIGDVIFSDTQEIIEETKKSWDSNKKLSDMVNQSVQKFIYSKSIVKSLELSDSLNLPSPIPLMPKNMFSKKKE